MTNAKNEDILVIGGSPVELPTGPSDQEAGNVSLGKGFVEGLWALIGRSSYIEPNTETHEQITEIGSRIGKRLLQVTPLYNSAKTDIGITLDTDTAAYFLTIQAGFNDSAAAIVQEGARLGAIEEIHDMRGVAVLEGVQI